MTEHDAESPNHPLPGILSDEPRGPSEPAFTDTLTRIPNRRHAGIYLDRELERAGRGHPLAVVFFELDHVDAVPEGRPVRDAAIRELARILSETTRKSNLSARWEDATFVTVLSGSDADAGLVFAERVRARVERSEAMPAGLTVTAGVAAYHPGVDGARSLLADAETALARARAAGRNRVRLHGRMATVPVAATPSRPAGDGAPRKDRRAVGGGRRVLLVEDDDDVRGVLRGLLVRDGFEVHEAGDADSALWELRREFDLLVTDVRLPGATGTELVAASKSRWPATQAIVITGMKDAQVAAEALNAGADRYLFKPFGVDEFRRHVLDATRARQRSLEDRRTRHLLSHEARERAEQARLAVLRGARALVTAVEVRDPYTRGHSMRVSGYAQILAGTRSDPSIDLESLALACELHDVGKIGIPDAILNKTSRLDGAEIAEVRRHPLIGRRILEPLLSDATVLAVVQWHHERWDGSGYPDGLERDNIPAAARVVGLVDALDAMTSTRAYRKALPWDAAITQIRGRFGTQFDPGLRRPFDAALPSLLDLFQDLES